MNLSTGTTKTISDPQICFPPLVILKISFFGLQSPSINPYMFPIRMELGIQSTDSLNYYFNHHVCPRFCHTLSNEVLSTRYKWCLQAERSFYFWLLAAAQPWEPILLFSSFSSSSRLLTEACQFCKLSNTPVKTCVNVCARSSIA